MDNISDVLKKWEEADDIKVQIDLELKFLEKEILKHLKEKHWKRLYDNESEISAEIFIEKEEIINISQLKFIISDSNLAQVTSIKKKETLKITTANKRKRLNRLVRK